MVTLTGRRPFDGAVSVKVNLPFGSTRNAEKLFDPGLTTRSHWPFRLSAMPPWLPRAASLPLPPVANALMNWRFPFDFRLYASTSLPLEELLAVYTTGRRHVCFAGASNCRSDPDGEECNSEGEGESDFHHE
jgi:hypothetical protein